MASRSPSQSEGEVNSSDSEAKAKTIPSSHNSSKVDRHTRPYSTSHDATPRSHRSRSRSPYRVPRGEKRPREYDHSRGTSINDSRTFSVRYEDERYRHHRQGSYEERGAKRSRTYSRSRSRSRSPYRRSRYDDAEKGKLKPTGKQGRSKRDEKPSSSALTGNNHALNHDEAKDVTSAGSVANSSRHQPDESSATLNGAVTDEVDDTKPIDEAALIEERRRRREAIKNKYRSQASPLLVQALQLGVGPNSASPGPESSATTPGRSGKLLHSHFKITG